MTAIVGFTEVNVDPTDAHVEYEVKVAVGAVKWSIMRRYSQFLALYEAVRCRGLRLRLRAALRMLGCRESNSADA